MIKKKTEFKHNCKTKSQLGQHKILDCLGVNTLDVKNNKQSLH